MTAQLLLFFITTSSLICLQSTDMIYTKNQEAKSTVINCDNDDICNINVKKEAAEALRESTINCPLNKDCSLTCTGKYSCYSSTINCPQSADCFIQCNSKQSCGNIIINGPSNANLLQIQCDARESCHHAQINAADNIGGKVDISSTKQQDHGLYRSKISCPQNGNCKITVSGERALRKTEIDAVLAQSLTIRAEGDKVLESAKIFCPHNSGRNVEPNCVVEVINNANMLIGAELWAVGSFKDLKVICKGNACNEGIAIANEDHQESPVLFCAPDYSGKCVLKWLNNKWFCDAENECDIDVAPKLTQQSQHNDL